VAKKTKATRKKTASSRGARKGGARRRVTAATTETKAVPTGLEQYPKKIVFTPIKELISSHIATLKKAPQTDDVQKAMKLLEDTNSSLSDLCRDTSMALNFR
jgi:hypothetical protein